MNQRRPGRGAKRVLPGALLVVACSGPSKPDAGDPCPDVPVNDAGMRCACETMYPAMGEPYRQQICDPDIGNPCPVGCFNPKEADGGRQYYDAGNPVCYC